MGTLTYISSPSTRRRPELRVQLGSLFLTAKCIIHTLECRAFPPHPTTYADLKFSALVLVWGSVWGTQWGYGKAQEDESSCILSCCGRVYKDGFSFSVMKQTIHAPTPYSKKVSLLALSCRLLGPSPKATVVSGLVRMRLE